MTVEDDYFSDAVFIGDSRTVGMFEYGGLEEVSTFYASKGLTIYKLFDSAVAPSPEGKITVEEALQKCLDRGITDWGKLKNTTKDTLSDFVWKKTKRRPMIMPIIMEVYKAFAFRKTRFGTGGMTA